MPGAGGVDRDGHFFYARMRGRIELVCGETVVRGCGSGCIYGVGAWMQLNEKSISVPLVFVHPVQYIYY